MRTEALALCDLFRSAVDGLGAANVFAGGDIDHLFRDDAGLGEFVLRDLVARQAAQGLVRDREFAGKVFALCAAIVFGLHMAPVIFLDAATLQHPGAPVAGEALFHVDGDRRIGIGAGRVIDRHGRLIGAGVKVDLAMRHSDVRRVSGMRIDLAAGGQGAGGDFGGLELALVCGLVHGAIP